MTVLINYKKKGHAFFSQSRDPTGMYGSPEVAFIRKS